MEEIIKEISNSFQAHIVDEGKLPILLIILSFGITFAVTRAITYSIREQKFSFLKDINTGEVHIHHLVWGILLLILTGFIAIGNQPDISDEALAIMFGIGAGLTLDEFALWLHLEDVYWTEKGRRSVHAVIFALMLSSLILVGGAPVLVDLSGEEGRIGPEILLIIPLQLLFWLPTIVTFLKGKPIFGAVSLFVPFIALIGAIRWGKPQSYWAKSRYKGEKLAKSHKRFSGEEAEATT